MRKVEVLSSARNPLLKEVRRAAKNGTLTEQGWAVAETFHLLEEALHSPVTIQAVIASESAWPQVQRRLERRQIPRLTVVADSLFSEIATTESSQGVMALVQPREWKVEDVLRGQTLIVVLDGIQDPGNAGAMVRSAEAFQATGLLFLKGTVNAWNSKTIRASAGSIFRVPLLTGMEVSAALDMLNQASVDVYATLPTSGTSLREANLTRNCAFIIGNEGSGVTESVRLAARPLRIPTAGVESLNASIAAAIVLYETHRQRSAA